MKLIIVRHGESEHNLGHLMVARGESRLTEKGQAQVRRVAERLRHEHINAAYSSPAERALDTARGILQFHPNIKLIISEALRERHMGNLEGTTREKFVAAAKASGLKWFEHKPEGGESMLETQARAAHFIHAVWPQHKGQTVLISSHGGFLRALIAHLMQHDYDQEHPLRLFNTAVTIIELQDEAPHIAHVLNDIEHLDEETKPITH